MKVFLSWSGDRAKSMAEFLQNWLPDVIQMIDPWVSSQSILQGSRPLSNIADELSGCNFGIVCVTPESRGSEWVNFEAGALSKVLEESMVVPLLLDIEKAQVAGPLSQFQMTISTNRDEVFKLVSDMNKRLGEATLAPDRLARSFEQNWPSLEEELRRITSLKDSGKEQATRKRSADDRLDEVLLLGRRQERRLAALEKNIEILARDRRGLMGPREDRGVQRTLNDPMQEELIRKFSEAEDRMAELTFSRLAKYGVLGVSPRGNRITVSVKSIPESDAGAIAEFREAVKVLANETECTVHVATGSGISYKYDWPF
ncbi:toll/interleukin-1 receptor domain-containing protein [Streptomyces sp. NPDC048288]|uniref:toll/interleukin-1 receptor domain-containing protein n=1 Tax=Streptomyces sp. NPDC048288 TaxID=3365529 RepID=UPI003719350C